MTCKHRTLRWYDEYATFTRYFRCPECGACGSMSQFAVEQGRTEIAWDVPPALANDLSPIEHFIKELT